ncbi:MAG: hypothetical protein AABX83_02200, partial [Nanoarchaeota archaeon]
MGKLIDKLTSIEENRFLGSDDANFSLRNLHPLLVEERDFPVPTRLELARNIRTMPCFISENLQTYFGNIYTNLLDKFGKVPVLMELLIDSSEFKEDLAYDRSFFKMAGLNYGRITTVIFDRIRAGAARFYFNQIYQEKNSFFSS